MTSKFDKMAKTLPSFYKAEVSLYLRGLLQAWGVSDDDIDVQIKEAKKQLFVTDAEGEYLDRNASNYGVSRSSELGIGDEDFRNLIPVLSTYPKQVRNTLVSLFDVFWGPGFTRANINSGNVEPFNFGTPTTVSGTAAFTKGSKIVRGIGTNFLIDFQEGLFIKPADLSAKAFMKISKITSNTELELSVAWERDSIALQNIHKSDVITLKYIQDRNEEKEIRILPNVVEDTSSVLASEISDFINNHPEHQEYLTASVFLDPLTGNKLNLRTNTPGLSGSLQITGGTGNAPSMLNFPLTKQTEIKAAVYELNPNEVVVQIPSSVPVLRRTLKGAIHPKQTKTTIKSLAEPYNFAVLGSSSTLNVTVDGSPYSVVFNHAIDFENPARASASEVVEAINKQLLFLRAFSKIPGTMQNVSLKTTEGSSEYQVTGGNANSILQFSTSLQQDPEIIDEQYPSSYLFDPTGQLYTVTRINAKLTNAIGEGEVQPTISVDDASGFPNQSGLILLDFGRSTQEGPITYNSRPNNSTLLVSASYVYQQEHKVGRYVNLIDPSPTIPRVTGDDYPVYIVGTASARQSAQDLVKQLIAAGVTIRFEISFPEVLFSCVISDNNNPDYNGYRSDINDLLFDC